MTWWYSVCLPPRLLLFKRNIESIDKESINNRNIHWYCKLCLYILSPDKAMKNPKMHLKSSLRARNWKIDSLLLTIRVRRRRLKLWSILFLSDIMKRLILSSNHHKLLKHKAELIPRLICLRFSSNQAYHLLILAIWSSSLRNLQNYCHLHRKKKNQKLNNY